MKNKALLVVSIGGALAVAAASALSFVSANEATSLTAVNAQTKGHHTGFGKMGMGEEMGKGKGLAMRGMGRFGKLNPALQTAVQNNDYNAFVTARNADTDKPAKATVPTQDQFNKMVAQQQRRTAVETAIKNNDYNAFVTAVTPTHDEFTQRVKEYNTRTAIDAALQANDYAAFQTAIAGTPMEGKITQDQFTKMVSHQKNAQ